MLRLWNVRTKEGNQREGKRMNDCPHFMLLSCGGRGREGKRSGLGVEEEEEEDTDVRKQHTLGKL